MALLTEKMARLEAQNARLEAQIVIKEQNSRIKELEQKVNKLEIDKRLSAQNSDEQALQLAKPISSSGSALRAHNAQLQRQIAARDATIAKQETEVSRLLEVLAGLPTGLRALATHLESKIEQGVAGALDIGRELTVQAAERSMSPKESQRPVCQVLTLKNLSRLQPHRPKPFMATGLPYPYKGQQRRILRQSALLRQHCPHSRTMWYKDRIWSMGLEVS